ncbi:D-alanyl-D-alanine carboxypeptidase [Streptoalloteichus tenebrarius]|uniref:D-alanyl-D-alanine carboxypeptidase n=1 Tax=Streptoalloteichus tenebrarius (strain ATCC 17920 / DSM 40477 / JCM 4838 / CBS 697.72 / NBRC 16177 / NCIMB 11028 / NRRL B-12390 / A12253. 1 / ISP 5477) TaxID=1933 RepID=A0ABT1HM46_STRSD|nr:serine hydrolase domain-containing protein [Streptoalloteichus tenebrarius]MCP2256594.1 D-alanyl-D-alanine carboxypeptidase [Streptoalloteichus tenebrarius]BFF04947.1 serine hydrolase domain-containing protein [Streptoalloteichus tenebrarius]
MTLTDRRRPRRAVVAALLSSAVLAGVVGVAPAALAATPEGSAAVAERCSPLPDQDQRALRNAIAGLPNSDVNGALVRVSGEAGCWRGTSGVAKDGSRRPVPDNARFRIGSMTKTFTAVTVLRLVADGSIDLDRPIQHYLPDLLPADRPPITVRQVLTYTSGLQGLAVNSKDPSWFFEHRFDTFRPGEQLDTRAPLLFQPGEKQHYGNADYIVAGLLVEKVTGRRWERVVEDTILRPLGMGDTVAPGVDPKIHGPHARAYEAVTRNGRTTLVDVTEANPSLQWSAASMISTAADLDRFLVALFSGRLLPQEQLDVMLTVPDVMTYDGDDDPTNDVKAVHSAGLTQFTLNGVTIWGKTGDRPGYNNGMGATTDLRRRLVYSVNTLHMGQPQPAIAGRVITAAFPKNT